MLRLNPPAAGPHAGRKASRGTGIELQLGGYGERFEGAFGALNLNGIAGQAGGRAIGQTAQAAHGLSLSGAPDGGFALGAPGRHAGAHGRCASAGCLLGVVFGEQRARSISLL